MFKILLVTSSVNLNGGGISSYAHDFINIFNYNEIYVISNDLLVDVDIVNKIKGYYRVFNTDLSLKNGVELMNLINIINPDIIINSNFILLSLIIPYVNPKIKKISISHFVDGKIAIIAGFNYKYYDNIIVLSSFGKDYLKKYYHINDSTPFRIIYNTFISSDLSVVNKKQTTDVVKIVYPGGARIYKNPKLVYKILKSLLATDKSFEFYWLGNTLFPGSRIFSDLKISDLFKNDDRVYFMGDISRRDAVNIISCANVFLLPSIKEGCPISLLEALSFGTIPLVSSAKHASSEIIVDGKTGFILSECDEIEYVNILLNIINNHERYFHIYDSTINAYRENYISYIWKDKMNNLFECAKTNYNFKSKYFSLFFYLNKILLLFYLKTQRCKDFLQSVDLFLFFIKQKVRCIIN